MKNKITDLQSLLNLHPYHVMVAGEIHARFSNLVCAAKTAAFLGSDACVDYKGQITPLLECRKLAASKG